MNQTILTSFSKYWLKGARQPSTDMTAPPQKKVHTGLGSTLSADMTVHERVTMAKTDDCDAREDISLFENQAIQDAAEKGTVSLSWFDCFIALDNEKENEPSNLNQVVANGETVSRFFSCSSTYRAESETLKTESTIVVEMDTTSVKQTNVLDTEHNDLSDQEPEPLRLKTNKRSHVEIELDGPVKPILLKSFSKFAFVPRLERSNASHAFSGTAHLSRLISLHQRRTQSLPSIEFQQTAEPDTSSQKPMSPKQQHEKKEPEEEAEPCEQERNEGGIELEKKRRRSVGLAPPKQPLLKSLSLPVLSMDSSSRLDKFRFRPSQ